MVMVSLFVVFTLKDFLAKRSFYVYCKFMVLLLENQFRKQGLNYLLIFIWCTLISFSLFFFLVNNLSHKFLIDSYIGYGFPVFFMSRTWKHIVIEWYLNVFKLETKYIKGFIFYAVKNADVTLLHYTPIFVRLLKSAALSHLKEMHLWHFSWPESWCWKRARKYP